MSKYFLCETDKPALSYKCGETIKFTIIPKENCIKTFCKNIKWKCMGDDGKSFEGFGTAEAWNPLIIETTLDKPGFVRLICNSVDEVGNETEEFDVLEAGAGTEVEKLTYNDTVPEDFDKYWAEIEKLVGEFTPQVIYKREITEDIPDDYKSYEIRLSTPIDSLASGIITMPEKAGKYPLNIFFKGYGISYANPIVKPNYITAEFNAHGFENDLTNDELREKYTNLSAYGFSDEDNADKYKLYWRNMMIRNLIAAKFLKTLTEWDKKGFVASGGSQGAFQATTVAAHDEDITFLDIGIPWFCDLRGIEKGFIRGWRPNFAEGLRYFDTVAQSMRVKCPVKISAYLGDYVCPPSGIMALYNSFKTQKSLAMIQGGTHGYRPPEIIDFHLVAEADGKSLEVKKGKYRHCKGKEYTVLDVGFNSETLEETVIYKANYGDEKIWLRPKWMFCETVCINGIPEKRFEFLN